MTGQSHKGGTDFQSGVLEKYQMQNLMKHGLQDAMITHLSRGVDSLFCLQNISPFGVGWVKRSVTHRPA